MNLFELESKFNYFKNKRREISYYIRIIDTYIEVVDCSKNIADITAENGYGAESLKALEILSFELSESRGKAWTAWCAYNTELESLENAKCLGEYYRFKLLTKSLEEKLSLVESLWSQVGKVNNDLSNIFANARDEYSHKLEELKGASQPGEE